jgi:hypothetical protein
VEIPGLTPYILNHICTVELENLFLTRFPGTLKCENYTFSFELAGCSSVLPVSSVWERLVSFLMENLA